MYAAVKPYGFVYYEYVLFYANDVICIIDDILCTMKGIHAKLKLKKCKIEEPDMYLGTELSKTTNIDGQDFWDLYYDKYCTAELTNVEFLLENCALRFPTKYVTPLSCCYHP